MKAKLLLIALLMSGCEESKPEKYKKVLSISHKEHTYDVVVTKHSGGNSISRGAGGAIIGGGADLLLGGSGKTGAIVGGLVGAATTDDVKSETYTETRTDITYTISYSDSSVDILKNYCPVKVGDSLRIW